MIANSIQIGWSNIDFTLLAILLPLLVLSAFFSCSETAFFRLTQAQCLELQHLKKSSSKCRVTTRSRTSSCTYYDPDWKHDSQRLLLCS